MRDRIRFRPNRQIVVGSLIGAGEGGGGRLHVFPPSVSQAGFLDCDSVNRRREHRQLFGCHVFARAACFGFGFGFGSDGVGRTDVAEVQRIDLQRLSEVVDRRFNERQLGRRSDGVVALCGNRACGFGKERRQVAEGAFQQRRVEVGRQVLHAFQLGPGRFFNHALLDHGLGFGRRFDIAECDILVHHHRRPLGVGQRIGQCLQTLCNTRERGNTWRRVAQRGNGGGRCRRHFCQRVHAVRGRRDTCRQQALHKRLGRRRDAGDHRHVGHRERTAHGMHGAQQVFRRRLRLQL
ncbi:hypothetical protein D3C81_1378550 [compost metagenome]